MSYFEGWEYGNWVSRVQEVVWMPAVGLSDYPVQIPGVGE